MGDAPLYRKLRPGDGTFELHGGWWVEVWHQHGTTCPSNVVWLSDEFFERPRSEQAAELERIVANTYQPTDVYTAYQFAFRFLFEEGDKYAMAPDLIDRVLDKSGAFSLEYYCAKVFELIRESKGWNDKKIPLQEEDKFDAGFKAGYLFREMFFKVDHEKMTLSGMKLREDGATGAAVTREKVRQRTKPRMEEMMRLVPKMGVNAAAQYLARRGAGTVAANKKLWARRKK